MPSRRHSIWNERKQIDETVKEYYFRFCHNGRENIDYNSLPRLSGKQLVGQRISKKDVQNIPPSFTPVDPSLYLVNGQPKNWTRIEEEKHMSRWFLEDRVKQEHKQRELRLIELRNSFNTTMPYAEDDLRNAVNNSSNIPTTTINRPRYEFYTSDPNYADYSSPLLMDSFSYCEGETLVAEFILNIRYMYMVIGRVNATKRITDTWVCEHHGINTTNIFKHDNHKHVIIAEFKFNNSCHLQNDHGFRLYDTTHGYYYNTTVEFLPEFTQQRYYLSLCTSIESAPLSQVYAYVHHHFFHGVQHFVFYINGQLKYWNKVLAPYAEKGLVELIDFTFPNHRPFFEQAAIINSCGRRYRYHSQFMIFTDVDEFFIPLNSTWRVVDVVRLYDMVYPRFDGFSVVSNNRDYS